ncbi:hypothetical protein NLJ89_g5125 [Agrocybe chaxingu]|uniref:Uncharacterized protein n=1 Tax=Agrocybe chaxingu TaxID=84603 RepID=A0A9W8MXH1_9AGAR|nr:hypothetical protein NLJ89_g5125 [Agrocybe chaxingu]
MEVHAPVLDIDFSAAGVTTDACLPGNERETMQFNYEALARLGVEYYYVSDLTNHTLFDSFLVDLRPSTGQGQELVL